MSGSKATQYPPQNGTYAVKVKNGAGWKTFDTARFQISVGQSYHEGEKLEATLEWAKHRFDRIIICVNDTLQRHNLIFSGLSEKDAFAQSEAAGREWIARNRHIIDRLPNAEVHRWEDWRHLPTFEAEHARIKSLYENDSAIRKAIKDEGLAFWQRRQKKTGLREDYRYADFQRNTLNYLIEECAAFSLMFQRDHAVDVYPGSTLLPCVLFKNEEDLGSRSFTRIDFSKNNKPANDAQSRPLTYHA